MTRPAAPPPPDLMERTMGLNRRAIRAVYPQIDWDQYDREVGDEARQPYEDALRELVDAAIWMSGSSSFAPNGEAHGGWLAFGRPALDAARSLLSDTEASRA